MPHRTESARRWSGLLRERLLHFLLLGGATFWMYSMVHGTAVRDDTLIVTRGKIRELSANFEKVWQREPTTTELSGLVDGYVREEVLYREARRMGLDRDDVVVRRRLAQKLSFLLEGKSIPAPSVPDLELYLQTHAERFRTPAMLTFSQIFIDSEQRGVGASAFADAALKKLRSATAAAAAVHGDPTLLPGHVGPSPLTVIGAEFGEGFAHSAWQLPVGVWSGPIASGFGLHLLRVEQRQSGVVPPLDQIRPQVEQAWKDDRTLETKNEAYRQLRQRYTVRMQ